MKVLVLGGYGAVGAHVVASLRDGRDTAFAAGRDPRRADVVVDLRDPHDLGAALAGVEVVVNATGSEDPSLPETVTRHGAAFVDITATAEYVAAVERLQPARPVVLSVGLAPGLTNLLVAAVHEAAPGRPIDIGLVLGVGERYGEASTTWAYGLLGRSFRDPSTGQEIRNYTRPRHFALPIYGRRRLYRADYSDQHVLSRDLGIPVRTYFGIGSRAATAALAALTWAPSISKAAARVHPPGSDRWLALAQSTDGTVSRWVEGRDVSRATGTMAAAAARVAVGLSPGVHHLHQVLTLSELKGARVDF